MDGNCQWYHRKYGVTDINQLSKEQLNKALKNAKGGVKFGGFVSVISVAGLIGGIVTLSSINDREDEGKAYTGVFITGISIPLGIAGLTILGINGSRKNNIKSTLNNLDLKMGMINNPGADLPGNSGVSSVPGILLKFNF